MTFFNKFFGAVIRRTSYRCKIWLIRISTFFILLLQLHVHLWKSGCVNHISHNTGKKTLDHEVNLLEREVIKKRIFYGQADHKGRGGREGGSGTSALTVSKCENFDQVFQWNLILWYSKHILSHCEGSQIFLALFWGFKWSSRGTGLLQMINRRGRPLTNE